MSDETKIDYDTLINALDHRREQGAISHGLYIDLVNALVDARSIHSADAEVTREAVRQALSDYRRVNTALTAEREWVRMLKEIIQTHHIERHGTSLPMELCRRSPCRALAQTQGKKCSEPDCHNSATVGDVCALHPKSGAMPPEFYDKPQGKEGAALTDEEAERAGQEALRALRADRPVVPSDGGRVRSQSEQFLAAWDTAYLHRSNHGFGLSRREEVLRNLDRIFDVDSRIGGGK